MASRLGPWAPLTCVKFGIRFLCRGTCCHDVCIHSSLAKPAALVRKCLVRWRIMARWFIEKDAYFVQMTEMEQRMLEEAAARRDVVFSYSYKCGDGDEATYTPYTFDLIHMTQRNDQTGTERRLLRFPNMEESHMLLSPFVEGRTEVVQRLLALHP